MSGPTATKVVSVLNLKGGVAKTTLTVALADTLAACFGKRVLVVDMDPQSDASVMLVGGDNLKVLMDAGKTLGKFFLKPSKSNDRQIEALIVDDVTDVVNGRDLGVSNLKQPNGPRITGMRLLASDINSLAPIQEGLLKPKFGDFWLAEGLAPIIKAKSYDHILIDCPPNFGIFTRNALNASGGYIIPAIPDHLSMTLGVERTYKTILKYFKTISDTFKIRKTAPKLYGIVPTKYSTLRLYKEVLEEMENHRTFGKHLMTGKLKQTFNFAETAMWKQHLITHKSKYPDMSDDLAALVQELKLA